MVVELNGRHEGQMGSAKDFHTARNIAIIGIHFNAIGVSTLLAYTLYTSYSHGKIVILWWKGRFYNKKFFVCFS